MSIVGIIVILAAITAALLLVIIVNTHVGRERRIRRYMFSSDLMRKFRDKYPQLTLKDVQLVARALRQFFLAHLASGGRAVGMPSRVVDDLWHEFILDTRSYTGFCKTAFGRYFHHVPANGLAGEVDQAQQLRATWRFTCLEENINPDYPTRLPLLFSIDAKLGVANGLTYSLKPDALKDTKVMTGRRANDDGSCGGFACSGGGLISARASAFGAGHGSHDGGHGDHGGHDGGHGGCTGHGGCGGGCSGH